jgi:hypothetical protein
MVIFESSWPTWPITHSTSKLFASSAMLMYVRRSVCGVVRGSGGKPRSAQPVCRERRGLADDPPHPLSVDPAAADVRERMGAGFKGGSLRSPPALGCGGRHVRASPLLLLQGKIRQ